MIESYKLSLKRVPPAIWLNRTRAACAPLKPKRQEFRKLKTINYLSCSTRLRLLIGVTLIFFSSSSFSSTPIVHVIPENESMAMLEMDEWEEQIYQAMEKEDLPVFWVKRGNVDLMAEIAARPEKIPAALYALAVKCSSPSFKPWCDEHEVILRLRDAAPENAAVYFADGPGFYNLNRTAEKLAELVTRENIERLRLASESSYVDQYAGNEASKWRDLVRKHVRENPQPIEATSILIDYYKMGIPESTIRSYYYPAERLAWKNFTREDIFMFASSPLENVDELCMAMAVAKHTEGIEYCQILADLLLNQSRETKHREMGHRIEYYYQSMINSDDPATVWRQITMRSQVRTSQETEYVEKECSKPVWFYGDRIPLGGWQELNAFYEDLSQFGAGSFSRAQKRELISAGLKKIDGDSEDPCGHKVINEEYRLLHEQVSTSVPSN